MPASAYLMNSMIRSAVKRLFLMSVLLGDGLYSFSWRGSVEAGHISPPDETSVGFVGRVARMPHIHQEDQSDVANRSGLRVRYVDARFLEFTEASCDRLRSLSIEYLCIISQ